LIAFASACHSAKSGPHIFPNAASVALTTSDTINRNPMPVMVPNDSRRARSSLQIPPLCLLGARQIRSSASCNSAKTDVAPTSSRIPPATVAATLSAGLLALSSSLCTASALSRPMRPCNCATISPRAASTPKMSPATEITISRNGAIENMV
jgi:hypothetical protein